MHEQLERRFKLGPFVGAGFKSTNGILQGCAISVILINLFAQVWVNTILAEAPGVQPRGYADDLAMAASKALELKVGIDITFEYSRMTGMEVSEKKSNAWATRQIAQGAGKPHGSAPGRG